MCDGALSLPPRSGACAGLREAGRHTRVGLHRASRATSARAAAAGPHARTRGGGGGGGSEVAVVSLASSLAARAMRAWFASGLPRAGGQGRRALPSRTPHCTHTRTRAATHAGRAQAGVARGSGRALPVARAATGGGREVHARRGRAGASMRRSAPSSTEREHPTSAPVGSRPNAPHPRCSAEIKSQK